MTVSVLGDYFTPWWMDQMFIVGIAAMLVIGFGGLGLGLMMLRHGFRPRVTPVLLMIFIPFMFAVTIGDLARQCAAPAHVGLGHRRTDPSPP